jgi:protein-tyrosine phosphatase
MSKILDTLFVASVEETYQEYIKTNASHILNVASELMIPGRVDHVYTKIGIPDDDPESDIRNILPACLEWIHDALENGGSVCVHCLEGKSRSVCVCIAYLCCKKKWSFRHAYNHIKQLRPCIDVFPLYFRQLEIFIEEYEQSYTRDMICTSSQGDGRYCGFLETNKVLPRSKERLPPSI